MPVVGALIRDAVLAGIPLPPLQASEEAVEPLMSHYVGLNGIVKRDILDSLPEEERLRIELSWEDITEGEVAWIAEAMRRVEYAPGAHQLTRNLGVYARVVWPDPDDRRFQARAYENGPQHGDVRYSVAVRLLGEAV